MRPSMTLQVFVHLGQPRGSSECGSSAQNEGGKSMEDTSLKALDHAALSCQDVLQRQLWLDASSLGGISQGGQMASRPFGVDENTRKHHKTPKLAHKSWEGYPPKLPTAQGAAISGRFACSMSGPASGSNGAGRPDLCTVGASLLEARRDFSPGQVVDIQLDCCFFLLMLCLFISVLPFSRVTHIYVHINAQKIYSIFFGIELPIQALIL